MADSQKAVQDAEAEVERQLIALKAKRYDTQELEVRLQVAVFESCTHVLSVELYIMLKYGRLLSKL